jgi:hypothetical protein
MGRPTNFLESGLARNDLVGVLLEKVFHGFEVFP